jgi:hypothetical protein
MLTNWKLLSTYTVTGEPSALVMRASYVATPSAAGLDANDRAAGDLGLGDRRHFREASPVSNVSSLRWFPHGC